MPSHVPLRRGTLMPPQQPCSDAPSYSHSLCPLLLALSLGKSIYFYDFDDLHAATPKSTCSVQISILSDSRTQPLCSNSETVCPKLSSFYCPQTCLLLGYSLSVYHNPPGCPSQKSWTPIFDFSQVYPLIRQTPSFTILLF